MQSKITTNKAIPQQLIAGIDVNNDTDIEFIGIRKNRTVQFLLAGTVYTFCELENKYYQMLLDKFLSDAPAVEYFSQSELPEKRKVEIYTYALYGDLDHRPDIKNGVLQPSENFRDSEDCFSIGFSNKTFTLNGETLNERDLIIIDMSARECTDYAIADRLNIALQTLDSYKTKIFRKVGCQSKLGLVSQSYREHLIIN